MAALEFLAGPAPARVVAADLTCRASRHRGVPRGSGRARLSWSAVRARTIRLPWATFEDPAHRRWSRWCIALDLDPEDPGHDRRLDSLTQLVEHLEGFVLVLDQRVALAVRAEPDPFAEMLHLRQVLHPLPVDGAQHHVTLDKRHQVGADLLGLPVIRVDRGRI